MNESDVPAAGPDWAAVRADYEGTKDTLKAICARHGVTHGSLCWHRKRQLWTMRNNTSTIDRPQIITRMFRLLERQLINLEKNMQQTGEKEVAVLGKLASTLEKLIDIDKAASPPKQAVQHKDIEDLRNKLAQRIAQLKRV